MSSPYYPDAMLAKPDTRQQLLRLFVLKAGRLLHALRVALLVASICELRELSNRSSLVVEDIRDGTASKSDESKKCACPLVAKSMIHLYREQDDASTPD